MLNQEQKFVVRIVDNQVSNFDSQPILVTGGPGTGKSTVLKIITNTINSDNVVWLGTTKIEIFFICGFTCHPKLYIPVNKLYFDLSRIHIDNLQNTLLGIKVVNIEKNSSWGKNYWHDWQKIKAGVCELWCPLWRFFSHFSWRFSAVSTSRRRSNLFLRVFNISINWKCCCITRKASTRRRKLGGFRSSFLKFSTRKRE